MSGVIQPVFWGDDYAITVYTIEHFLRSMRLSVTFQDGTLNVLEDRDGLRFDQAADASMVVTGYQGTATGHGDFRQIIDAALDGLAPEDFSWTDKGTTPASMLTPKFWLRFPKASWRIRSIECGPSDSQNPLDWSFTMRPKFVALTS